MNSQAITTPMAKNTDDQVDPVWRRHVPGYALTALVILVITSGVLKLMDPKTLPIRQVSVKGEFQYLSTDELQKRASEVVRGGFFNVNVETIQKVLLEEPWIREVSVKRIWPDRITVSIREQTAVARWNNDALLNDNAQVFAPDKNTFPSDIPALKGPSGSHSQVLEFYQRLDSRLPGHLRIAEVTFSDRRAWHVGFSNGPHVYLGRTSINTRMTRFAEYVPQKLDDLFNRIRSVDMRYTNGFAVRWEPDYKPDLL